MNKTRFARSAVAWAVAMLLCLWLAAPAMAGSSGDGSWERMKKEWREAGEALADFSAEQRDEAAERMKKSLNEMDERIDDMERDVADKWQDMDRQARENAEEAMKALRKQRKELAEWYGGLKHSSAKAWKDVKKGFIKSYDSMAEALDEAKDHF